MVQARLGRFRRSPSAITQAQSFVKFSPGPLTITASEALLASWRLSRHDKAPRTIDLYLRELRRFADWLAATGHAGGDLAAVSRQGVETWIRDQQTAGRAKATIRSQWIALRSFYGWLVEEDEITVLPVARVRVPKLDAPPPDVLSADTIRALLRACEGRSFEDRREAALIRFMLTTGLRVSETCALAVADVDLALRLATVRAGKGDKTPKAPMVPFDPATDKALDRYLQARARHRHAEPTPASLRAEPSHARSTTTARARC